MVKQFLWANLPKEQIQRFSTFHENLMVLDLHGEKTIYAVHRFMFYAPPQPAICPSM